jgi:BirA family biotin operon repressor/biotin-[acetyl-CoA-carboxylase] ligase
MLGRPRLHLKETSSTNDRARALAAEGAPHGTLVTAAAQSAGRGRQGRTWTAPPGTALLMSVVIRDPTPLLSLAAGVAVAEVIGEAAQLKWPNDVLVDGRKVAGILVEGRPQEGWAVLGIGVNVAVEPNDLPPELHATAGTLGRPPGDVEVVLELLLTGLAQQVAAPDASVLAAFRARDALRGKTVRWAEGEGRAAGVDDGGRLVVETADGTLALAAGEVHLVPTEDSL